MNGMIKGLLGVAVMGSVLAAEAQNKFPLKVDIDVSTKRSKINIGAGSSGEAKVEQVQVIVKIRKSSGEPWTDPVGAELYVIGKQIHTGYYGIIDVQKGSGTFDKENDNSYKYTSPMYALGKTTGNVNVGGVYETYLVVITDHNGKIVSTRCGRSIRDEGIAFIRELGRDTLFDRDGNVVGKIDEKNSAFKKAVPAAVSTGNRRDD